MPEGQAHPPFPLEELDPLRVVGPTAPQNLDGDDAAGFGILGPENPAETAGGDLVENLISAQVKAVGVSLDQLLALPGGQVALALREAQEQIQIPAPFPEFHPAAFN